MAGRVFPCSLAFLASFCIMVVELVAGRIIARHVGHSLYTWTSVIGIVLGGISIGNLLGGRLADWFPPRKTLAVLFLAASVSCLLVPLLNDFAGDWSWLIQRESWRARVAIHVALVFLLPAAVLGLTGPVVAKLALDQGYSTGKTVGNVYAWGAIGSICGTFATGFYLIPLMKTSGVIFSVSGVLALVGIALLPVFVWPMGGALVVVAFLLTGGKGYWDRHLELVWDGGWPTIAEKPEDDTVFIDESQYSFIEVTKDAVDATRDLVLDNLIHSHYVHDDPLDLRYEYEIIYAAITERYAVGRSQLRTLFLGGGGYIFPRYVQARWPGSLAQVAEIDPVVTQAAMAGLGLRPDQVHVVDAARARVEAPLEESDSLVRPIWVYHLDARNHVDDLTRRREEGEGLQPFDFIYGDAFNDFSVPFHLVTLEFNQKIRELLRPQSGIYMLNLIDIYASGKFVGAVYCTFRKVFPRTYVFVTNDDGPSDSATQRDTWVIVGALGDLDLVGLPFDPPEGLNLPSLLEPEHLRELERKSGGVILTDEYSPVENLLEVVVQKR